MRTGASGQVWGSWDKERPHILTGECIGHGFVLVQLSTYHVRYNTLSHRSISGKFLKTNKQNNTKYYMGLFRYKSDILYFAHIMASIKISIWG